MLPKHHSHVSRCHSNTIYDSAAKRNSIAHAGDAATAITVRSAEPVVESRMEFQATAAEIAAPKPDPDAKAEQRRFCTANF